MPRSQVPPSCRWGLTSSSFPYSSCRTGIDLFRFQQQLHSSSWTDAKPGFSEAVLASWLEGRRHHLQLLIAKVHANQSPLPRLPAWPVLAGRKRREVCRSRSVGKRLKISLCRPRCAPARACDQGSSKELCSSAGSGSRGQGTSLEEDEGFLPYPSGPTSLWLSEPAPSRRRSVLPGRGARSPPASVAGSWEWGQCRGQGCSEGMLQTHAMAQ